METRPVMQNFLGHPVRVYRTGFQVEMRSCNTGSSSPEMSTRNTCSSPSIFTLKTFAIPFPDFCEAVGYNKSWVLNLIKSSADAFAGLWRTEQLPDSLGRMQPTILLSQGMVDGLVFKLHTSRIKDPETRARVVEFQRFIMFTLSLIRRRKILPVRIASEAPLAYQNMLALASSFDLAGLVRAQAETEGKSISTIYRKLARYRGSNVITKTGQPRKRRAVKE